MTAAPIARLTLEVPASCRLMYQLRVIAGEALMLRAIPAPIDRLWSMLIRGTALELRPAAAPEDSPARAAIALEWEWHSEDGFGQPAFAPFVCTHHWERRPYHMELRLV